MNQVHAIAIATLMLAGCDLAVVGNMVDDPHARDAIEETASGDEGPRRDDVGDNPDDGGDCVQVSDVVDDGGIDTGMDVVPDVDAEIGSDAMNPAEVFDIRIPARHQFGEIEFVDDADFVCTLVYGDLRALFYIQTTPVSCSQAGLCQFETEGAWVALDGHTEPVDAEYNWGGHHHNDWIRLKFGGYVFKYYHSSFGFGFRACHEPDCLQIELDDEFLEDGCGPDRSIPIVCRMVWPDGTVDSLEERFERCPGDGQPFHKTR